MATVRKVLAPFQPSKHALEEKAVVAGGIHILDNQVTMPDSEGYTKDSPNGVAIKVHYWEDFPSDWNNGQSSVAPGVPDVVDVTDQLYQQYRASSTSSETDPLYPGFNGFLSRLVSYNYADQVTGANLEQLSFHVRDKICEEFHRISAVADTDCIPSFSMTLNPTGDYFAQLASRDEWGNYHTDPNGDVLRLKYVTHGNYVKFTVGLNAFGQIADPFSVLSGGPSFTLTFDVLTRIDLRLPHNSGEGLQLVPPEVEIVGADLHAEDADGAAVLPIIQSSVISAVNDFSIPVGDPIGGQVQQLNSRLSQLSGGLGGFRFDQANFSIEAEGDDDTRLVMEFTEHPKRDFQVSIDSIDQQSQFGGRVRNFAKVQIGTGTSPVESQLGWSPVGQGYIPVGRHYDEGIRSLVIQVQIWRQLPDKPIGGKLVNSNGRWFAQYEDGTIVALPPDFNPHDPNAMSPFPKPNPKPPVKPGYLRSIFLHIDYAAKSITGRRPDNSIFKVQSGDPIHIPGDTTAATGAFAVLVPEIQFTVTMSGTRHGVIPDGFQVPDPPMPQVVAGAAGIFG